MFVHVSPGSYGEQNNCAVVAVSAKRAALFPHVAGLVNKSLDVDTEPSMHHRYLRQSARKCQDVDDALNLVVAAERPGKYSQSGAKAFVFAGGGIHMVRNIIVAGGVRHPCVFFC